jgi:hypothetical protein
MVEQYLVVIPFIWYTFFFYLIIFLKHRERGEDVWFANLRYCPSYINKCSPILTDMIVDIHKSS